MTGPNTVPMPAGPGQGRPLGAPQQSDTQGVAHVLNPDTIAHANELVSRIRACFSRGLIGQQQLRESLIVTLMAGGHILIESAPGLAKTTAARLLASSVSGSFSRIQCTPDLMPADLVGTQVFDFATQRMTTQIGPVHANIVLLDEINRSSPKTQSAMLEAMAEGATTIGGESIPLPSPFMVIATQNPIDEEGTYTLPEAQMDRFMMKTVMTYPTPEQEGRMLDMLTRRRTDQPDYSHSPETTISLRDLEFLRDTVRHVHVAGAIMKYVVDLVSTTRGSGPRPIQGLGNIVRLGASPRASIALVRVAQAQALLNRRDYVVPEDVKDFATDVLRHRVLLTFEAQADDITSDEVIDRVIKAVPVP
ncbi:MAG: MoxR family ATPase [Pseudoscardovia radai]|nr:MoxR family ATPase [Pseudoscardovia radai]